VIHDELSVGQPHGHPPIRRFLGVPLLLGNTVIGMIGVANKLDGYHEHDQQVLATFANQVAVAVDNGRLYARQRQMIDELQALQQRVTEAERAQLLARERDRIAGALHDRIEQEIFAIGIRLNAIVEDRRLESSLLDEVRGIRELAIDTADEIRRVIFALSAPNHEGRDLTSEIRALLRDLERRSPLHAHLSVTGEPVAAVDSVHGLVRSVVSEALTNIRRHADATVVLVTLRYASDRVDIIIQDDGVGAPEIVLRAYQDSQLHFGLRHMSEQLLQHGGSFEVRNGEEGGLVLKASVPLPSEQT
jgi:signal transduction histidine kinase